MSNPTSQPGAGETPDPDPAAPSDKPAEGKTFDEAYVKKLRDEAAGYRTKLKEYEDRDKTEAQKQADALAEALAKVQEYETREQIATWKDEVVNATDLDDAQKATLRAALRGSTKEEIEAHAETLKPLIAKKPAGPVVPSAGDTPPNKPASDERSFLRELFGEG